MFAGHHDQMQGVVMKHYLSKLLGDFKSEEELRELELDHRKLEPSRAYFLMLPLSEI